MAEPRPAEVQPEPAPGRWLTMIAMTGALALIMLDQTVVSVALPSMSDELPLSPNGVHWVLNAYVLAMAALTALGARLGDRIGRPATFRWGVLLFVLASAGCGLVPAGPAAEQLLIAGRVLQGAGAALIMPVAGVMVVEAFGKGHGGRAIAIFAGVGQIFLLLGPLLGGICVTWMSWRSVFLIGVPIGVATLILLRIARPPAGRLPIRLSALDATLLSLGLAAITLALQESGSPSWSTPMIVAVLAGGGGITAIFVVRQHRSAHPLVKLGLLADRGFLGNVLVIGLVKFGLLGVTLFTSIYAQEVLGFGPIAAGSAALPMIVPMMAVAQFAGRWFDRAGVRPPVITGLVIGTLGAVAWLIALPTGSYGWQVPGMVLVGLGWGLSSSPTHADSLAGVDDADRGHASGLVQTVRQLGGTLGLAVVGALALTNDTGDIGDTGGAAAALRYGAVLAVIALTAATIVAVALLRRPAAMTSGTVELNPPAPPRTAAPVHSPAGGRR